MIIKESLQQELGHIRENTLKVLELITDEIWNWKPHTKSWSTGHLATHIANLLSWFTMTLTTESMDIAPEGAEPPKTQATASVKEVVERFNNSYSEAAQALDATTEESLLSSWTMFKAGQELFTMPKIAVVRNYILNHLIHHRAQLCLYLRLNDIPIPGLYGPSADELEG
jgi:uncharacterized damage-inducible protein DinB